MTVEIPGYVAGTWDIDPVHSDVSFVVRHLGLTRFRRGVEKFGGQIVTAPDPLDSAVTATVDLTSLDTGLESFNRHLAGAEFLDLDNHPTAEFRSSALRVEDDGFALDGELSLRGAARPVRFALELLGFGTGINGDQKVAFSAAATIRRSEFGIVFDSKLPDGRLIVGEQVQLLLEIEAVLRADVTG
ncbi:YceI family protein [Amycolatopsis ultiminotia]|uniref:YceI family protein n=1 Tax=Amycolatopsis ultiminotia TaxID=543629 RepID=A0ABP6UV58_9PSEU